MPKYKVTLAFQEGEYERSEDTTLEAKDKNAANEAAIVYLEENYGIDRKVDRDHGLSKGWYWYHEVNGVTIYDIVEVPQTIKDNFTEDELLHLLEAARVAFADAETYDMIAEDMDLSDDYLKPLIEKLHKFMNPEVTV